MHVNYLHFSRKVGRSPGEMTTERNKCENYDWGWGTNGGIGCLSLRELGWVGLGYRNGMLSISMSSVISSSGISFNSGSGALSAFSGTSSWRSSLDGLDLRESRESV